MPAPAPSTRAANDNVATAGAPAAPTLDPIRAPVPIAAPTEEPVSPSPAAESLRRAGPQQAETTFSPDEELILEIATARHELSDTIIGYRHAGATFLPLGAIARFLDLAISVSDGGRYAAGTALDPGRPLAINLRAGTATLGGVSIPLAPGDAVAQDGEMYLRAERFADLLPLVLTPNLRDQTVSVQTRAPFPFEQKLARAEARERLANRQTARSATVLPRRASPWLALSVPMIDAEVALASDSIRGTGVETDLRAAGDLAWLTAKSYVSADTREGLTGARLELGRQDPDGRLLGPLAATAFSLGDVTSTPMTLGLAGVDGRGVQVSNAPLEQASVFDQIDLRGEMPDGYEAELYRNDVLIDTARAPADGQYRFRNIPVEFGLNVFRVVLYGPQGQRRETVRQIAVGDGRLAAGELRYAAGVVQRNRPLFNLRDPAATVPGLDDGAWRSNALVQYGLTTGLTMRLGAAFYQRRGQAEWLATTGLVSGFAGLALRLDLGLARGGAGAMTIGLARTIGGFNVAATHATYRGGFVDEVRTMSDVPLARATDLSINGVIRIGSGPGAWRMPVNGFARDITFADGHRTQSASLNQTVPLARAVQLANLIEFDRTRVPLMGAHSQLRGAIDLTTLARSDLQLRGSLAYGLVPNAAITAAAIQLDRRVGDHGSATLSYSRNFAGRQDRFGASAITRLRALSLALDGSYANHPGQFTLMLRAGLSLGLNPFDHKPFLAPLGLATGGAVALRAYRDVDGDGQREAAEPALADARFYAGSESGTTDRAGVVILGRLGDGRRARVHVDADSLPDIDVAPRDPGIELVARAGRIQVEDIPFRVLGSVDGTATLRTGAGPRPLSGVVVALVDPAGRTVGTTRTGTDGTFWFEQIPAGSYRLALEPSQAARLHLRLSGEYPVKIGGQAQPRRQLLELESTDEILLDRAAAAEAAAGAGPANP